MFSRVKVEYNYERTVWWLGITLGIFLLIYGWLVAEIIFDVVRTNQLANRLKSLESEVATLEGQRLSFGSKITLDLAYQEGFRDAVGQTIYVSAETSKVAQVR